MINALINGSLDEFGSDCLWKTVIPVVPNVGDLLSRAPSDDSDCNTGKITGIEYAFKADGTFDYISIYVDFY